MQIGIVPKKTYDFIFFLSGSTLGARWYQIVKVLLKRYGMWIGFF